MSAGPRLPLDLAQDAAAALMLRWGMGPPECMAVGSVRRKRPDVGDLELIAPLPAPGGPDALHYVISRDVVIPRADMLFDAKGAIGTVVAGLERGFRHARLSIRFDGRAGGVRLPVEVYRYVPGEMGNRGWLQLMRTGPREFGVGFLEHWRRRFGLPKEQPASKDGYLRNAQGVAVPAPDEVDLFRLAGLAYIEPADRVGNDCVEKARVA